MGTTFSSGKQYQDAYKYGQVFFEHDKGSTSYFGGETVCGKIHVNIYSPYPAKQLVLKLKGREAVHLVKTRGNKVRHEEEFKERHEIIKKIVPVGSWNSVISGQYTIPFAFLLPSNLPSSFHQEGYRFYANISYRLEAILEPETPETHPKLKFKQDLIVRKPSNNAGKQTETAITTQIKKCGCGNHGSTTLDVKFERNWYSPGEVAGAIVRFDNSQSQVNNTDVLLTLKQKIEFQAHGSLIQQTFTKGQSKLTGIAKGQPGDFKHITLPLLPLQGGDYSSTKRDDLKNYLLGLPVTNKVTMSASTQGALISSEYFLEVSCPMEGCCVTTPSRECPVDIFYPDIVIQKMAEPDGWQPTTMDIVNLSFGGPMPVMTVSTETESSVLDTSLNANLMTNDKREPFL